MTPAPTHRITFTPWGGAPQVACIRLVAQDHRRLRYQDAAPQDPEAWWAWSHDHGAGSCLTATGGWSCGGAPTPHWQPGTVVIEPLQPRWAPTAARWTHGWE